MSQLLPVLVLAVFVMIFGVVLLWFSSLISEKGAVDTVKDETYECGLPSDTSGPTKISIKFYLTAILFILFDIEIIFMYPWAVTLAETGWNGFAAMLSFVFVLLVGFIYVWKKGVLNWND